MKQKSNNADSYGFLGSFSSTSIRNLLPISSFRKPTSSNPKSESENIPPTHPKDHHIQSNSKTPISPNYHPVKVVVRIKPENRSEKEGEFIIKKVSSDALFVGDKQFKFDEVLDTNSNQEDVFQSVGVPLVRNALAGYNTSILSYGQSGSGKTYTMWGPPSAMIEESSRHSNQGIVPRIFRMLFSELERERLMSDQKQFSYQCRCSFVEIYNYQIRNLLSPNQQNLEIKDDSKNGLYIDNLIEEYVTCYDEVAQILIKGLLSRKSGATGLNSNSSRSHVIFTFVIESLCKGTTKGFSSSKASRISLIDLAGLDRNEVDNRSNCCLTESKLVEKSLSQLGQLVDALIDKSPQSRENEEISYSNSSLTQLLQDSFGGNAKLSVICSIFPSNKSNDATLGTLRFGEKLRSVRNKPVINVIKDADDSSDKIRHLKEELISAKADVHSVPKSINQLRVSLNRSLLLSNFNDDTDEAVNISVDDIRQLRQQIDELNSSCEENLKDITVREDYDQFYSVEGNTDADKTPCLEDNVASQVNLVCTAKPAREIKSTFRDSISVSPCSQAPILEGPQLSESPKFSNKSWNNVAGSSTFGKYMLGKSSEQGQHIRSSLQSSKAESLAASLQKGLQIIDFHQQSSALNKSSTSFSFGRLTLAPCPEIDTAESCNKTIKQKNSKDEVTATFLCASCRKKDFVKEELENVCKEQAARIEQLNQLVETLKREKEMKGEDELLLGTSSNGHFLEEKCEIKEIQEELAQRDISFDSTEKELLLEEIRSLRSKLQLHSDAPIKKSTDKLRSSLLSRSTLLHKSGVFSHDNRNEELENERQRWTEMESDWICLTDELRADLESYRQHAEKLETELNLEKKCTAEMDDALKRAVNGHGRMVEHYTDLQEKYDNLVAKHDATMEGIAEVKKAIAKASKKGPKRFAKSLSAELSALRVERERESKLLKRENQILKIQLRDTAEAVQAAGELLVRLREAEQAASVAEENLANVQQDNEELRVEMEKLKRKQKTEINTMKQYLVESKLPESALKPLYGEDSDAIHSGTTSSYAYDDQAWRAEFGAIYQDHY